MYNVHKCLWLFIFIDYIPILYTIFHYIKHYSYTYYYLLLSEYCKKLQRRQEKAEKRSKGEQLSDGSDSDSSTGSKRLKAVHHPFEVAPKSASNIVFNVKVCIWIYYVHIMFFIYVQDIIFMCIYYVYVYDILMCRAIGSGPWPAVSPMVLN